MSPGDRLDVVIFRLGRVRKGIEGVRRNADGRQQRVADLMVRMDESLDLIEREAVRARRRVVPVRLPLAVGAACGLLLGLLLNRRLR